MPDLSSIRDIRIILLLNCNYVDILLGICNLFLIQIKNMHDNQFRPTAIREVTFAEFERFYF